MTEKRKNIIWMVIFSLCIQMIGAAANGEAAEKTISITEFYNNYLLGGDDYVKTIDNQTVVTISDVEEMRYFFKCLGHLDVTEGISFRQEADIFFSNYTYSYNHDEKKAEIYSDGKLLGIADQDGKLFRDYVSNKVYDIWTLGLKDAYIERVGGQFFAGAYDGQGHVLGGFILSGGDDQDTGLFGYLLPNASVFNLNIQQCLLLNACGTFVGGNRGTIADCTAEYVVGLGRERLGGIAVSSEGILRRCKLNHSTLVCTGGYSEETEGTVLGGIICSIYEGEVSDCAVEDSQMISYEQEDAWVGGIAGFLYSGVISDCANFGSCSVSKEGKSCIVGGIAAYLRIMDFQAGVYNCISAGNITGKCAGGIAGEAIGGWSSVAIVKNCVSLSKVDGSIVGGLAGEALDAMFLYSYYYDRMANGEAVGEDIGGSSLETCYAVNCEQVYGKPSAVIIDENGTYSDKKSLLDALNSWVEICGYLDGYLNWKEGKLGYPVLVSRLGGEAPVGDYVLDDNENITLNTPAPTNTPGAVETPKPTSTPGAVETPKPTNTLGVVETPRPTSTPGMTATPSPNSGNNNAQDSVSRAQLAVRNLNVGLTDSLRVKLDWNKNKYADGYQVFRSTKKAVGYQVIGEISQSKLTFIDKNAKSGHTYYYMVRAYKKNDQKTIYGEGRKKKIEVAWFKAPEMRLNKGVSSEGKTYVQVRISKYSGSYVEVYFKADGKKYVKAPLKSEKITLYKGKLRFSYKKKSVLYCKIRTYQIKQGKKRYSMFSKERKIRL